jgi:uncharacterized protein (TIGR02118 family)
MDSNPAGEYNEGTAMTRVLVLYAQPSDSTAFERYYFETHVPIAKKIPGLRSYQVSARSPGVIAGDQPPYLVTELSFDNEAAVQAALKSPEGQATASDLANFARAGVTILTYDVKEV